MIPDNVEKIIMTKEDYDRNVEQLLVEKLELEQELQKKDKIINSLKKWLSEDNIYNTNDKILAKLKELENDI